MKYEGVVFRCDRCGINTEHKAATRYDMPYAWGKFTVDVAGGETKKWEMCNKCCRDVSRQLNLKIELPDEED